MFVLSANVIEKIINLIDGVENERELLIRLAVAVGLIAVVAVFRNKIASAFAALISKLFSKSSEKVRRSVKESLSRPLAFFAVILSLYAASEILAPTGQVRGWFLTLLKIGFIVFAGWFGINFINSDYSVADDSSSKSKKTAVKFMSNILKALIAIIAALMVLEQFGISATKIFAALGIGGVAVAVACKDTVENLLSGFIIIFDKPFEVDDCIEVDGVTGTVEDITIRTTRLRCLDGSEAVYPNTAMANAKITNWTRINKRLFHETLWINYCHTQQEIENFCQGLRQVISGFDSVLQDDVRINFTDYGTHALEISMYFYVSTVKYPEYLELKSKINCAVKNFADSCGIKLAFTSNTVYFGDELKISK